MTKMRDISCKLLSTIIKTDDIGVQTQEIQEIEIPIIKTEKVYASEYYKANALGQKPSLRLRISALNYNNEEEIIYMNTTYSIIRKEETTADELILVCERKLKNVKNNKTRKSSEGIN